MIDTHAFEVTGSFKDGVFFSEFHATKDSALAAARTQKLDSFQIRRTADDMQVYEEFPQTKWL